VVWCPASSPVFQESIMLANVQVYWDAGELGERLHQAMRSRATIEHAVASCWPTGLPGPRFPLAVACQITYAQVGGP
jgi:hypothetical protein